MVERSRRRKQKRRLLGGHQKSWLWGRHVVRETLRAGRWPIVELLLSESLPSAELKEARQLAGDSDVALQTVTPDRLRQLCGSGEHQGYLARMAEFPYADVDEMLVSRETVPLLVILDGIQDPFNFGAIVRTAEVLGADGLVIGTSHQCEVTSQVARSSAGAVNHVPIARVADLPELARRLQSADLTVIGTDATASLPLFDADFTRPCALVIGNEGDGIHPELRALCDTAVRIPQSGQTASLNAAVSAGVLLYEAQRQRARE